MPSPFAPLLIAGVLCLLLAGLAVARPSWIRGLPAGNLLTAVRIPLVIVGIVLVASTFLPSAPQPGAGDPIPRTVESIAVGRTVYLNNCAACHGVDARGGGPASPTTPVRPPPLTGPGSHLGHHADQNLFESISNGLPGGMPAFGEVLSDDDIWHVVNFLRSVEDGAH